MPKDDQSSPVGKITDFFWKRQVVRIEVLDGEINDGDTVHVTGEYTDETFDIEDMEIDDEPVETASEDDVFSMPLSMKNRVMIGDEVYLANDS